MSDTQITTTAVLDTFESLTGRRPEQVEEGSDSLRFAWGDEDGILRFRERAGEHFVSVSILVTDEFSPPAPLDDVIFRYVATHSYVSEAIGALQAVVTDDELVVRSAVQVSLGDCTEAHLAEVLQGLVERARQAREEMPLRGDPYAVVPANAWLVVGDELSFFSEEDLESMEKEFSRHGVFSGSWTASKKVQFGDLLLVYYRSPRKAVHFVARAASDPYFNPNSDVGAATHVSEAQWWVDLTPPIEIDPIPYSSLQEIANGHLILQGQSGKYLRPEAIEALAFTAVESDFQEELDHVATTPVGAADLPDPASCTIEEWRSVSAGSLDLEERVSQYIVEPLVRLADAALTLHPQVKLADGAVPDFVVRDHDGADRCVIEVKQAIEKSKGAPIASSKAFAQLRRYQEALDLPGVLIDAHRVVAVARDGQIVLHVRRDEFTEHDVVDLGRHLAGDQG